MRRFIFQIDFLTTLCALSFVGALYTQKWPLVCLAVASLTIKYTQALFQNKNRSELDLELQEKWKVFDHNFLEINRKILEIDDKASKAMLSKLTHK